MLFGYRIFCGLISGVLVDTSWENAKARVREHYKDDAKYLKYREREKELCEKFGDIEFIEPLIEIYNLSERFDDNISCIFELTI